MTAQTLTVTNFGGASSTIANITFNTPSGISHTANLVNFGGPAEFGNVVFPVSVAPLEPYQQISFTLDYQYENSDADSLNGNVIVYYTNGEMCVANTTIIFEDGIASNCVINPNQSTWSFIYTSN